MDLGCPPNKRERGEPILARHISNKQHPFVCDLDIFQESFNWCLRIELLFTRKFQKKLVPLSNWDQTRKQRGRFVSGELWLACVWGNNPSVKGKPNELHHVAA